MRPAVKQVLGDQDYIGNSQSSEPSSISRTFSEATAEALGIPRAVPDIRMDGPGDGPAGHPVPPPRERWQLADFREGSKVESEKRSDQTCSA